MKRYAANKLQQRLPLSQALISPLEPSRLQALSRQLGLSAQMVHMKFENKRLQMNNELRARCVLSSSSSSSSSSLLLLLLLLCVRVFVCVSFFSPRELLLFVVVVVVVVVVAPKHVFDLNARVKVLHRNNIWVNNGQIWCAPTCMHACMHAPMATIVQYYRY